MNITQDCTEKKKNSCSLSRTKTYYPPEPLKKKIENYSINIGSASELVCTLLDNYFKANPSKGR